MMLENKKKGTEEELDQLSSSHVTTMEVNPFITYRKSLLLCIPRLLSWWKTFFFSLKYNKNGEKKVPRI